MTQPPERRDDDLDPDLLALRRPRAGVGPLLLVSVVGLSTFVLVTLFPDFRYWMGPHAPREVGRGAWSTLADNSFVGLDAPPDRSRALRLRGQKDAGRRVVPVQGTNARLWVAVEGDANLASTAYDEKVTGRVRRLKDLTYVDELRDYLAHLPPQPRFVSLGELAAPGQPMKDLLGDELTLAATTAIEVEERIPGAARVTVVRTDALRDANRAQLALKAALHEDVPPPAREITDGWVFEIPGDPGALRARLTEAKLFAAVVEPRYALYRATRGDLSVTGDQVRFAGRELPVSAVEHAAAYVPTRLPDDAMMLIAGDAPADYWYVPVVYALLVVLSALLVWAFLRTL